jgi:hypothetical protein
MGDGKPIICAPAVISHPPTYAGAITRRSWSGTPRTIFRRHVCNLSSKAGSERRVHSTTIWPHVVRGSGIRWTDERARRDVRGHEYSHGLKRRDWRQNHGRQQRAGQPGCQAGCRTRNKHAAVAGRVARGLAVRAHAATARRRLNRAERTGPRSRFRARHGWSAWFIEVTIRK